MTRCYGFNIPVARRKTQPSYQGCPIQMFPPRFGLHFWRSDGLGRVVPGYNMPDFEIPTHSLYGQIGGWDYSMELPFWLLPFDAGSMRAPDLEEMKT